MSISHKIYNKGMSYLKIFPYRFLRWLDQINKSLLSQNVPPQSILNQLKQLGCDSTAHMNRDLLTHFQGTYQLLKKWGNQEAVCLAGLCHALYGTQTFPVALVSFSKRQEIAALIGEEAEKLAYYYSIITRQHFTENLKKNTNNLAIKSRLDGSIIPIQESEFIQLLEIFLADHLEQIFSINYRYRYQYQSFFLEAKPYLSQLGFKEFLLAYNCK
ncbi:MAG: hypothetical protein EWV75_12935 [Microcystis wesenbergii Mw_QC_S_20081001_S30D]|jgi:hypothetical protein|uniref:DUF6817 domain-containing protein n=1 Tax=Microcystis wesenbergii Mw_QC_S_20081001_S30D TaxID=2486245 RepID=A0A552JJ38_9CHRO|nr:hypothetical protein [Microcystis sp. Msp_OC_L_20101000_S702]TRU11014.1 MAG: hypothetical protein EWV60_08555 [Microcystis sp. Msp_OC_L_20101000_S702]TRU95776.1 MAG: hypothetical protein EWV75_12935 [Microcystis wesenbergii Mw_QC_S_20081001_S30D]